MKERDAGVKWFNTVFYPENKTGPAVRYEDGILPRLRENKIQFFTPWGPRYSWEQRGTKIRTEDSEVQALCYLAGLMGKIKLMMPEKNFRWLVLGADLYGTRINNLPTAAVSDYFHSLETWLQDILPIADFQLWSTFDAEAEKYRQEIRRKFKDRVDQNTLDRAIKTAQMMGRGSSAHEYLVERIAEANLIEETLRPIKISCVAKHKDANVDADLPRLYLLPPHLNAPWL